MQAAPVDVPWYAWGRKSEVKAVRKVWAQGDVLQQILLGDIPSPPSFMPCASGVAFCLSLPSA